MRVAILFACSVLLLMAVPAVAASSLVRIGQYPQEAAVMYGEGAGLPSEDVWAVSPLENGDVLAATARGLARFTAGAWEALPFPGADGPAALRAAALAPAILGNAEGQEILDKLNPFKTCHDVKMHNGVFWVATDNGIYQIRREKAAPLALLTDCAAYQLAVDASGQLYAATARGLYAMGKDASFAPVLVDDGLGRQWATAHVRGVAFDAKGRLWCAMPAGAACRTGDTWEFHTGREGLPCNDFTGIAAGGDGSVWFGTRQGAIRFDGKEWAYRQGRRWLPEDHVRHIAIDAQGNAWFATAKGVGCIERRMMTLAQKAEHYEHEIERYIKRTPFGYVAQVGLKRPGDKSEVIHGDDDNDGLWTSMYGAGECFAYGATRNPLAKQRAKKAFDALRFLQTVAQGGQHSPPKGYVARTIRSVDDPDPNFGRVESDRRHRAENDALWKVYEPRWPKSADGKWYWKSDTSSDELDGHYFFYPAYYDLVAETEEEKQAVRDVVRALTDHLMEAGYYLVDFDGTPTRWGIYGPTSLNHDPNWWAERGLKSLSILSYLAVAEHITGDPKYGTAIAELVEKHGYRTNAMIYKLHFGLGSGNQSDDEMAFMCYYNLMKYAKDEALRSMILTSFYLAWTNEQPEMNPFFHFAYAAFGVGGTSRSVWGEHSLSPWEGWMGDAMATLKGFPLDRLNWAHSNSHRLDIVHLPRQQSQDPFSEPDKTRGYRYNGKVLPVEERFFHHWNTDPWALDYGGDGRSLASGTVFLLPYYMGLYHGFIVEEE